MNDQSDPVASLTPEECRQRLGTQEIGRLVTRVGDVVDIFPVNYVLDAGSVLFRTAEGSKLFELTVNDEVLFEVDDHTEADAWSVVIRGHAHRLATSDEVERADALPLQPWIPTLKYNYVRIEPTSITGRFFRRGPEPERYGITDA